MRRQTHGKKIDFKQWDAAPGLLTDPISNQTILGGGLSFAVPATLLRFRGYVAAQMGESGIAILDRMIITVGLCIVSTDAFTVGASAVPDPSGEPEFPWIWWKEFKLESGSAVDPAEGWGPRAQRYEIDSKAMRKIKPGETFTYVVQATSTVGAALVHVDIGQVRVLIGT